VEQASPGEKARVLTYIIRQLRNGLSDEDVAECVSTFNALSIPRGYIYVDSDRVIHVVMIRRGMVNAAPAFTSFSAGVIYGADVVWDFDPVSGTWLTLKDRTELYESLCPIKCGGIPTVKPQTKTK
jgi:hypothetical protein